MVRCRFWDKMGRGNVQGAGRGHGRTRGVGPLRAIGVRGRPARRDWDGTDVRAVWIVSASRLKGVGKTHVALAIAKHRLQRQNVVVFHIAPDLLDHLRGAFAPTVEMPYDELFLQMKAANLLVIDDLGAEQGTEWANEKFFQLLNYRYSQALPAVITTNRSLFDFDLHARLWLHDRRLVRVIATDDAQDYREVVE
jgi:hypothetical protein